MSRAYNFSAGPAALPEPVLEQAQREMLEFGGAGASIVELSHRGPEFMEVAAAAERDLRALVGIPDDYAVLFTSGGATTQQALMALNFASAGQPADYVVTGHWGSTALGQAAPYVDLRIAASSEGEGFRSIPPRDAWRLSDDAAYVHITANETIHGVEFRDTPDVGDVPLFADFSSSIASEPLDVSRYGMIYAGAQKNLGPSGVTLVVIRKDLAERAAESLPTMLQYRTHVKENSLYNTPPTFGIYMIMLVTRWLEETVGGLDKMVELNARKAKLLYDAIDQSGGFYRGHAQPAYRSKMNVTWRLPSEEAEAAFLSEATKAGLASLKGHRSVGGIRASIYNAMSEEGVTALRDFMVEYQRTKG